MRVLSTFNLYSKKESAWLKWGHLNVARSFLSHKQTNTKRVQTWTGNPIRVVNWCVAHSTAVSIHKFVQNNGCIFSNHRLLFEGDIIFVK